MGGIARSRGGVGISSHQGNRRFTNRWQFDGEMRKQDHLGAFPLVQSSRNLIGLKLPLAEIGYRIDDNPGYTTAKIDNLHTAVQSLLVTQRKRSTYLVQQKTHQSRRNDWVPYPNIPGGPLLFEPVQRLEVGVGVDGGKRRWGRR